MSKILHDWSTEELAAKLKPQRTIPSDGTSLSRWCWVYCTWPEASPKWGCGEDAFENFHDTSDNRSCVTFRCVVGS